MTETFGIHVSPSWTWQFVPPHSHALQNAAAYPQEDNQMRVRKETGRADVTHLER
jgi:hypothetical protein